MSVYSFYTACCICDVFYSVFSVFVHVMYIFLSLFSVDGFYCAILSDIVLICCCTPDNDVDSPSPDMGRHDFWLRGVTAPKLMPISACMAAFVGPTTRITLIFW